MPEPSGQGTVAPPRIVLPSLTGISGQMGQYGGARTPFRDPMIYKQGGSVTPNTTSTGTGDQWWRDPRQNPGTAPSPYSGATGRGFGYLFGKDTNPFMTVLGGGIAGSGVTNPFGAQGGAGTGGAGGTGVKPDKWQQYRDMAKRMGLDWNVTVGVYLNPNRNGFGTDHDGIIKALGKQKEDGTYMEMARRYGVMNAENEQLIMDEHWAYMNGKSNRDPLFTGHPEAVNEWNALADNQNKPVYEDKPPEAQW